MCLLFFGRVWRAGLPGALWCASPFPLAALPFCFAWPPPGWGCPPLSRCPCRFWLPWRCALVVFLGLPLPGSSCARASRRRVEERVKSNEATKGTRGSQQPSKGLAQRRGHGRHTSSTTPHRDTGEGSTRGTREERHRARRHARHRHHKHRTHPATPNSPPSGRAVGGGIAPDLRCPSQRWKAPPTGMPFSYPHS